MNPEITISLSLIFSIIAAFGVVVTIYNTLKKSHETEEQRQLDIEKNFVKVNLKLDTFCDQTREILKNQEKSGDELRILSEQTIIMKEKLKDYEARIKRLEN